MAKLVTLRDANGEVIYPQSVWDENMIPDNTVTSSMIDWSTMSENQSDIRKIHYSTFTATTDNNGFAAIPKTMVTPSTGMVIGASTTSIACFTLVFNDNDLSRYTVRVTGWDLSSLGGRRADFKIAYILY